MNKQRFQKLQERAKEKGKILLIEDYSWIPKAKDIETLEKVQLVESGGTQFQAFAIIRNVPVTRFIENLNGRLYPKKLWERILKLKVAERTYCLADHPDDEGSVKNIVGVWHNFRLGEDCGYADLYLVGSKGGPGWNLYEAILAGGRGGMSSVGFGELESDGKTVQWESYELERLSDWVMQPSQQVFATQESSVVESAEEPSTIRESQIKETVGIGHTNKRISEDMMSTTLTKIVEGNFRNQVNTSISASQRALNEGVGEKILEAKYDLESLIDMTPEEMKEEHHSLQEALTIVNKGLAEKVKLTEKTVVQKHQDLSSMNEKYNIAAQALTSLKEKYEKATKVINLLAENEKMMKADLEAYKEDITNAKGDNTKLLEDRVRMLNDIRCLLEDSSTKEQDIRNLMEDLSTAISDVKRLLKDNDTRQRDINALMEDSKLRDRDIGILRAKLKEAEEGLADEGAYRVDPAISDETATAMDPAIEYRASDDNEFGGLPMEGYDGDQIDMTEKHNPRNRSRIQERVSLKEVKGNSAVLTFYQEEVKKNPALAEIKKEILKSGSLIEAIRIVESYASRLEDAPIRISESIQSEPDWLRGRK